MRNIVAYQRTAFLWVTTQRVVIIPYRRFGTTCRSHLQAVPYSLHNNLPTSLQKPEITHCMSQVNRNSILFCFLLGLFLNNHVVLTKKLNVVIFQGVQSWVVCAEFSKVTVASVGPYACEVCRICRAYPDCGLLDVI